MSHDLSILASHADSDQFQTMCGLAGFRPSKPQLLLSRTGELDVSRLIKLRFATTLVRIDISIRPSHAIKVGHCRINFPEVPDGQQSDSKSQQCQGCDKGNRQSATCCNMKSHNLIQTEHQYPVVVF